MVESSEPPENSKNEKPVPEVTAEKGWTGVVPYTAEPSDTPSGFEGVLYGSGGSSRMRGIHHRLKSVFPPGNRNHKRMSKTLFVDPINYGL